MLTGSETMDNTARLLSVNVGLPRDVAWRNEVIYTGIWKTAVDGRRWVRRLNIDGDGQGDLAGHGGEQRAVLVYQMESYRYWQRQLLRNDFVYGQFGENFTVDGLPDDEVCVGDIYRIGSAMFEVTQPRVTCYRVGVRMNEPRMAALLVSHDRPGFYLRVLKEGDVGAGDEIVKVAEGPEGMTVAEVSALLYMPGHDRHQLTRALRIPALSTGWQHSFQALLDRPEGHAPGNPGLTPVASPPAWAGFRPLRVAAVMHETQSVVSVLLEGPDGAELALPLPGQYVTLRLITAPGSSPLIRSYSLSGNPGPRRYCISVKKEGEASTYIAEHLLPGQILDVAAPRGLFVLQPATTPIVFLSAGIGATPVMAMLHTLAEEGSRQEIWWLYGTRSSAEHVFAEESRRLLGMLPNAHTYTMYSQPLPGDVRGSNYDGVGRLGIAVLERLGVPRDATFYLCGPTGFLRDLSAGLLGWGVAPMQLHSEIFGSLPSLTPGLRPKDVSYPHQPTGPPGDGPHVSFLRSGISTRWGNAWSSLLELAEACDVPVRWACRTGVCHSCESGLVDGKVEYAPEPLDAPAAGSLLLCCARPLGDVVLDV